MGEWPWANHSIIHNFIDDAYNHVKSFLHFLLGFALAHSVKLWPSFQSMRWPLLDLAILRYAYILFSANGG
ncbi:MAG: hypothetical protein COA42_10740 [Alteromonadaceae bacterium]|nr:MAG: hypothetical protein COA42_10740 [Alteromonadaceae bacterium]